MRPLAQLWITAALATLAAWSAPAVAADDPADIVSETAGTLIERLDAVRGEIESDPDVARRIVREELLPVMDQEYSARLILGRAGRDATPQQISAFAKAMSEELIGRYASGLAAYSERDQLRVMPSRGEPDERMTRVRTRVQLPDGKFIPVDYVFRKADSGWKVFDVIVEGISYVTTYRNQIMPQVQASGIDAVTERLRRGELKLEE